MRSELHCGLAMPCTAGQQPASCACTNRVVRVQSPTFVHVSAEVGHHSARVAGQAMQALGAVQALNLRVRQSEACWLGESKAFCRANCASAARVSDLI